MLFELLSNFTPFPAHGECRRHRQYLITASLPPRLCQHNTFHLIIHTYTFSIHTAEDSMPQHSHFIASFSQKHDKTTKYQLLWVRGQVTDLFYYIIGLLWRPMFDVRQQKQQASPAKFSHYRCLIMLSLILRQAKFHLLTLCIDHNFLDICPGCASFTQPV